MEENELLELIGSDNPLWVECVMYMALEFEFIKKEEIPRAKKLLLESQCSNADQFFDKYCEDSSDKLLTSLVNATQI